MGDIEIWVSAAAEVCRIHAHTGFGLAVAIKPGARRESGFLKRAIAPVAIKEIHNAVVGHENVRPAVTVEIRQNEAKALPPGGLESSLRSNVAEPLPSL